MLVSQFHILFCRRRLRRFFVVCFGARLASHKLDCGRGIGSLSHDADSTVHVLYHLMAIIAYTDDFSKPPKSYCYFLSSLSDLLKDFFRNRPPCLGCWRLVGALLIVWLLLKLRIDLGHGYRDGDAAAGTLVLELYDTQRRCWAAVVGWASRARRDSAC